MQTDTLIFLLKSLQPSNCQTVPGQQPHEIKYLPPIFKFFPEATV